MLDRMLRRMGDLVDLELPLEASREPPARSLTAFLAAIVADVAPVVQ